MKPLILVKHSLPEIVQNIPAREWTLSAEGRKRAQRLAEMLHVYQPDLIACSMEPKARETAAILAENLRLPVHPVEGLHEHDRSSSPYYLQEEFQKLMRKFFENPETLVFGHESATEALTRFRAAVDAILKSYEDKSIIIVAHGTVISLFVSWLTGCDSHMLWRDLGLPSSVVLDLQSRAVVNIKNLP